MKRQYGDVMWALGSMGFSFSDDESELPRARVQGVKDADVGNTYEGLYKSRDKTSSLRAVGLS